MLAFSLLHTSFIIRKQPPTLNPTNRYKNLHHVTLRHFWNIFWNINPSSSSPTSITSEQQLQQKKKQQTRKALDSFYLTTHHGRRSGIPGLASITRKDIMALTMQRMKRTSLSDEFSFYPDAFVLPFQQNEWYQFTTASSSSTTTPKEDDYWILKPPAESCGDGIHLVPSSHDADRLAQHLLETKRSEGYEMNVCVCRYVSHPATIRGHKFDLRLYAVVLRDAGGGGGGGGDDGGSSDHDDDGALRVFLYYNGFARFATRAYYDDGDETTGRRMASTDDRMAHLTNYSLNVQNDAFVESSQNDDGTMMDDDNNNNDDDDDDDDNITSSSHGLMEHKWSLTRIFRELQRHYDNVTERGLREDIATVVAKVTCAARRDVDEAFFIRRRTKTNNNDNNNNNDDDWCFELVGVDVMFEEAKGEGGGLQVKLLEVQNGPSLMPSSDLDLTVKGALIDDVEELLRVWDRRLSSSSSSSLPDDGTKKWRECHWCHADEVVEEARRDERDLELCRRFHEVEAQRQYDDMLARHTINPRYFQS